MTNANLGEVAALSLIADLYERVAALARAGDLKAAKLAHDTAGQLLEGLAPEDIARVTDLRRGRR